MLSSPGPRQPMQFDGSSEKHSKNPSMGARRSHLPTNLFLA